MNHREMVESERKGNLVIGVDRPMARKFYTDVSMSTIESETGEAPYLEKSMVWFTFLAAPLTLCVSIVMGFLALGVLGLVCLLTFPILYLLFASSSAKGNARILGISVILLLTVIVHFSGFVKPHLVTLTVVTFVFSLWCIRALYCSSTMFLRLLVVRNERAYHLLNEYLTVRSQ